MKVWYIVECKDCESKIPFVDAAERGRWADLHRAERDPWTGLYHDVKSYEEIQMTGKVVL